uniref:Uncharacterized protein n=1 Tax=Anguilla anguilla TaxID=7936 RepID=A0A0E9WRA2_ANGAN
MGRGWRNTLAVWILQDHTALGSILTPKDKMSAYCSQPYRNGIY